VYDALLRSIYTSDGDIAAPKRGKEIDDDTNAVVVDGADAALVGAYEQMHALRWPRTARTSTAAASARRSKDMLSSLVRAAGRAGRPKTALKVGSMHSEWPTCAATNNIAASLTAIASLSGCEYACFSVKDYSPLLPNTQAVLFHSSPYRVCYQTLKLYSFIPLPTPEGVSTYA
jgi:hypothetical protein